MLAALDAAPEGEQLNLDDLEFTDRALEELAEVAAAEADGGSAEATGGGADAAAPPGDQPAE